MTSVEELKARQDSRLKHLVTRDHDTPDPRPLAQPPTMKRVARPLRDIKHIPTKSLKFYSKVKPPHFSYSEIPLPIPSHCLVVEVRHVGLNPVDVKIVNSYSNYLNKEIGLGREFSGIVTMLGSNVKEFKAGDRVMGVYWHVNVGQGCCETSLLVDPSVDPIVKVPSSVPLHEAAGSMYVLGTAFNILKGLEDRKLLTDESSIFINGGTTNLGLQAIQLIKYHFRIPTTIVVSCSAEGGQFLQTVFPDIEEELLFIDYNKYTDISVPLRELLDKEGWGQYDCYSDGEIFVPFRHGKFSVVLDFIGGYDVLAAFAQLLTPNAAYITTVGDTRSDYTKDKYTSSWQAPIARTLISKYLWSFYYEFHRAPLTPGPWTTVCASLLQDETVKVIVAKRYDWKDMEKALKRVRSGHTKGKVILDVERF